MKNILLSAVILCLVMLSDLYAVTRYDIETAFIFKFIKFIEWPATENGHEIFNICFIGGSQLKASFDILEGKSFDKYELNVIKIKNAEETEQCKILYIENKQTDAEKILDFTSSKPILTVGSRKSFLEAGGIINFMEIDNKIKFEINYRAAKSSKLQISSKLLRLASNVVR